MFSAATAFDCNELVSSLRAHDRAEVDASRGGLTALDMWSAVQHAHAAVAARTESGRLICIFGASHYPGSRDTGIPWLLGTDLLDRHMLTLCKYARGVIAEWHTHFPLLTNMTDKRNHKVVTWLRHLGFKFGKDVLVGPNSTPFIPFFKSV